MLFTTVSRSLATAAVGCGVALTSLSTRDAVAQPASPSPSASSFVYASPPPESRVTGPSVSSSLIQTDSKERNMLLFFGAIAGITIFLTAGVWSVLPKDQDK